MNKKLDYHAINKILKDSLTDEEKLKMLPKRLRLQSKYWAVHSPFSLISVIINHFSYWLSYELEKQEHE